MDVWAAQNNKKKYFQDYISIVYLLKASSSALSSKCVTSGVHSKVIKYDW